MRRRGWLGWLARALLVVVALAVLVVAVTAVRVWHLAREDDRRPSDAIMVLGSAQYDGRPSAVLAARLDHAARLYRSGVAPRIVTLGGSQPGDRFTEAGAGAAYLTEHGIPASDVVAVERGTDTLESLTAAAEVFAERGWSSAVLVTDPWHSLRARAMARDLGLEAVTSPARSGPAVQSRATQVRYILRETAAYLFYRIAGDADPPENRPPAF